jgi:hypothetical protein
VLVHRSQTPRRVLSCGVRWGKSLCAAMEAVAALLAPRERVLGWTVAPTFELSELVYARVIEALEAHFRHRIKQVGERDRRIVVRNFGGGLSELRAKSADNPDSLLGAGLDFLIIDETARLPARVWNEHLSQRLLDRKGWALLVSTPRGRDWFYKLYRRGQKRRDPQFESWSRPSWDNPHVDKEMIEAERQRLTTEVFAAEYAGEFVGENLEPCDVCGGPDPAVPGHVIVQGDAELPRCKECSLPIDETGHSLVTRWPNGQAHLHVVHLMPRRFGPVPIPMRSGAVA